MKQLVTRRAEPADYDSYARLFPELGTDDSVPTIERYQREIMPSTLVLQQDGGVVAFGWYELLAELGYVRQLVVDPRARRQGLGRRLMLEMADRIREAGCRDWCLNVRPDNEPAVSLYCSLGMREDYSSKSLRFAWSLPHELPEPAARSLVTRLATRRAELVEHALGLAAGQLAQAVATPDRIVLEVQDPATLPLGVAVFDPGFPGAFPFRVKHPEWAKPLLVALEPFGLPDKPYMQVVVEGDPELARLLTSHGATVRLHILHLKGEL